MKNSKTAQAIAWIIAEPGRSQYRAAQLFGVSQSALSLGMKKREENAALWKEYGARIEAGDTRGIPHKTILRALRGRYAATVNRAPELSATARALDHIAITGCSVVSAARKFELDPGTLYAAHAKERTLSAKLTPCDGLTAYALSNQFDNASDFAAHHKIDDMKTARQLFALHQAYVRRGEALNYMKEEEPVHVMRKRCATLARMVGGEAGEGIAQAIEALQ